MGYTLAEIADALDAQAVGDTALRISGASEPTTAGPDQLAIALDPQYAAMLSEGSARAALLSGDAPWKDYGLAGAVLVGRARYAMSGLTQLLDPGPELAKGIHPTAIIDETAEIGDGAAIGPYVVIGRGVRIGARARIAAHVSVAEMARLGDDLLLYSGVRIGAYATIGDRFIAHHNASIAADGFSFVTPEKSAVEEIRETVGVRGEAKNQSWTRIHSLGSVTIGDDVEVGANACIDRGTIRDTIVGRGTKLDNHTQVGHNVVIGEDCLMAGMSGVAGSSVLGNRVVLGGHVGVNDNIVIGDDVIAGGGSKIASNAPAGRVLWGYPATKMDTQVETYKALRRLPRLFEQVSELKKAVSKLSKSD
ncbi:MAG: UDP-3-O-(3-hydroxymyristoyl)glucosamine N-acyltransferase [Dinoroseobacter sp.]|nr:UDP-3-O-(3-hydroxymyristoyl)glucosamine N-acyltransferase [Dinoroseobacter sp.]